MNCDNITDCHLPEVIYDSPDAMVAICKTCYSMETFTKDPEGRMDNRKYMEFFKREHLQPWTTLYWKYNEDKMSIV